MTVRVENDIDDDFQSSSARSRLTQGGVDTLYQNEREAEVDHLNRESMVQALSGWLGDKSNTGHLTIGLLGNWGAGKSSFIQHLKAALKNQKGDKANFIFGDFNAWAYEHSDNIQAGLGQEVIKGLTRDLSGLGHISLTLKLAWRENKKQITLFLFWLSILAGLAFWLSGVEKLQGHHWLIGGGAVLPAFKGIYASATKITSGPLMQLIGSYLRLPDFGKHIGILPVMRQKIKALCDLRLGDISSGGNRERKKRYLFVVDDLDRCSPQGIVKTFEAVRLVMEIPGVVVIIAIDHRIALAALAQHYEGFSVFHGRPSYAIARDFLAKILHSSLILTEPKESAMHVYLDRSLWPEVGIQGEVDADLQQKKDDAGGKIQVDEGVSQEERRAFKRCISIFEFTNPRQVKRLYNSYKLYRLCGKKAVLEVSDSWESQRCPLAMVVMCFQEWQLECHDAVCSRALNEKIRLFIQEHFGCDPDELEAKESQLTEAVKPFVLPALSEKVVLCSV